MLGTIVINKQKSICYGKIRFFKHKCGYTQKGLTLEDCIVKMFVSAGMEPYRDGNKFSVVVLGKHYTFIVTISSMEGNELCVYVRFPETVRKDVASAVNYEVKRLGKEAVETLSEAQVSLLEKGDGYHIIVKTVKKLKSCQTIHLMKSKT